MSRSSAVIAVIIAAVAGFFVGRMTGAGGTVETGPEGAPGGLQGVRVPVRRNAPGRGAAENAALVTIVEFSDFQ